MDSRTQLIDLILAKSYREGDFTLSSGQKSSFYIDLKAATLSARGAQLIGELSIATLREAGLLNFAAGVGGLTLGADPIATAVSLASLGRAGGEEGIPAFIVRKEPKGHGTGRFIEGLENLPKNSGLIIVEDVSTTGKSAMQAVEKVRDAGFHVLGVLTVVDREQGAREFFEKHGLRFVSLVRLSDLRSRYRR
jgi:orotate phosphoribosyltransferase